MPVEYRSRGGTAELSVIMDELSNLYSRFEHRLRSKRSAGEAPGAGVSAEAPEPDALKADGDKTQCSLTTAMPI